METVKNLLEFLDSYPLWAKVLAFSGLLITMCVLVFSPRTFKPKSDPSVQEVKGFDPQSSNADNKRARVHLKIEGITVFPSEEPTFIQVDAIVNDTNFRYPHVSGIQWLEVGPTMSKGVFELPASESYNIYFKARTKDGAEFGSQELITITKLPYKNEYRLYKMSQQTRSASISLVISFSVN